MEEEIQLNGPAEFDMHVFVINDESGQRGKVTIGLGVFRYPTPQSIKKRIEEFEQEELIDHLNGFRLMTKREAVAMTTYEKTGLDMVAPVSREWDDITATGDK
jgi:hypothetical protein